MRKFLIAIFVLIVQSVTIGEVLACRGPFKPVSEIVKVSSSIFIAKVVKRLPASESEAGVELQVAEVLKGYAPDNLIVGSNALVHPNDICLAIESGETAPHLRAGEEWLVSGNFDASRNFLPTNAGNFRLANPDGRATEGRNQVLSRFRQVILRVAKKSRSTIE